MSKIYYAIKPHFSTVTRYVAQGDYARVYDLVQFITGDHETAASASAWCELASVGEKYVHEDFVTDFTIEIIEE